MSCLARPNTYRQFVSGQSLLSFSWFLAIFCSLLHFSSIFVIFYGSLWFSKIYFHLFSILYDPKQFCNIYNVLLFFTVSCHSFLFFILSNFPQHFIILLHTLISMICKHILVSQKRNLNGRLLFVVILSYTIFFHKSVPRRVNLLRQPISQIIYISFRFLRCWSFLS